MCWKICKTSSHVLLFWVYVELNLKSVKDRMVLMPLYYKWNFELKEYISFILIMIVIHFHNFQISWIKFVSLFVSSLLSQPVNLPDREVISRLRNCLLALAAHKVLLYDTSVLYCYESSLQHQVGVIVVYDALKGHLFSLKLSAFMIFFN